MTYLELLDLAYFQAMRGVDAKTAPNRDDATPIFEALVPTIFQDVALAAYADPEKRSLLNRTHTIVLISGVGTLPNEVLTGAKFGASVSDPDDATIGPLMSLVLNWNDFISPLDDRLGYWIIKGDNLLHWINPNEQYDPSSGKSGNITITIATVPEVPATAGTTVDAPDEITSDLVTALAEAMRGEIVKIAASKAA